MIQPQASTRIKIEFAQSSDPGRDPNKQVNEDSCGYAETKFGHLCVLCDGMGGHYGGKEASRLAITTIFEIIDQTPTSLAPGVALKAAIEEAGRRVYRLGGPPENRTRPGSTAVAMVLHDRGVDVAHVGDSRAYVIRANQIYPLTRDHSMVQGMIDAGLITEAQAIGHPDANKITRALGMKPEVEVELRPEPMELFPGDILLMSSDGLTDLALAADILGATRQALASGGVAHACEQLIKMANERGGHDNITVQMVRVADVGPKVSTTIPQAPSPGGGPGRHGDGAAAAGATPAPSAGAVPVARTGPPETVAMTSPDSGPAGAHAAIRDIRWAPVPPTAADGPGAPPSGQTPYGARPPPTITEQPPNSGPSSHPQWNSGMYQGPGGAPAAGSPQAAPGVTVMAAPSPTSPGGGMPPPGPTPPMTPVSLGLAAIPDLPRT